jgi:hypothetical protein
MSETMQGWGRCYIARQDGIYDEYTDKFLYNWDEWRAKNQDPSFCCTHIEEAYETADE